VFSGDHSSCSDSFFRWPNPLEVARPAQTAAAASNSKITNPLCTKIKSGRDALQLAVVNNLMFSHLAKIILCVGRNRFMVAALNIAERIVAAERGGGNGSEIMC
jgi:hypothetical protein